MLKLDIVKFTYFYDLQKYERFIMEDCWRYISSYVVVFSAVMCVQQKK